MLTLFQPDLQKGTNMKRVALAFLFGIALLSSVKADTAEDIQFEQYVEASKENLAEGMSVVADKKYRIIILTMPIAVSYQDAKLDNISEIRNNAIKAMREETADVRIIKALKINIVYNFITIDKKVIPVAISYHDL